MNNKEPIIEFKDLNQVKKYLKWWQHKLFLDDWIIKIQLVPFNEMKIENSVGYTDWVDAKQCARIDLAQYDSIDHDTIERISQEKTLVHELLHLKLGNMHNEYNTYESVYLEASQHKLVEQMAKSFIMVKYNLDFKWFYNKKEENIE